MMHKCGFVVAWAMLLGVVDVSPAVACRCRPQSLESYFTGADHVFFGRLTNVDGGNGSRLTLGFDFLGPTYKGEARQRTWVTGANSAACGLPVVPGLIYLLFAQDDDANPGVAHVTTCNGSRLARPDGSVADFVDVPSRYVVRTLEAWAAAPDGEPLGGIPKQNSIIGLLDVRGGAVEFDAFASPHAVRPLVRQVSAADLERRELGYERPAIVVTGRAGVAWYRVRKDGKPLWLNAPRAVFRPLAEIVVNRLNYLTQAWNGVLWPSPGAGLPFRTRFAFERSSEVAARVRETVDVADSVWFKVEIYRSNPCDGGEPRVLASGYLPAWNPAGELTAWYWSRGC